MLTRFTPTDNLVLYGLAFGVPASSITQFELQDPAHLFKVFSMSRLVADGQSLPSIAAIANEADALEASLPVSVWGNSLVCGLGSLKQRDVN
jgi:hypothetical protein